MVSDRLSAVASSMVDQIFHSHARDSMLYAIALNDRAVCAGERPPFLRVSLGSMCNRLNIVNSNLHDALADCLRLSGHRCWLRRS
jgi:DNA polymerase III epsilon subunit-like protein